MESWKRFRNIHPKVRAAARDLIVAKWWRQTPEAQLDGCRVFVVKSSVAYGMDPPTVTFDPAAGERNGYYLPGMIGLPYFSAVTLFHEFRHAWQHHAGMGAAGDVETDAQDWSHSLMYAVAPRRFRRMVAAGRIVWVPPTAQVA